MPNFAVDDINICFFTHHTLPELAKLDLIVLLIASEIIQGSLQTFLTTSQLS